MPTFVTDQQLNDAIADTLQKPRGTLDTLWNGIVTNSNGNAYWEIVGRLSERGFLPAQIAAWDRGAEFQLDMGVYNALQRGASMAPDTYSQAALARFDRRDELAGNRQKGIQPVGLTIAGVWQDPGTWPPVAVADGTVGQAATGETDTCDLHMNAPGDGFMHRHRHGDGDGDGDGDDDRGW